MFTKKKIEILEAKCEKCEYTWHTRVEKPKRCPNCKRADWNKPKA